VPRITSLKVDGAEFREVNGATGMGAGAEFFTSQDFPRRVGKMPQPAGTSHVMNPPSMG